MDYVTEIDRALKVIASDPRAAALLADQIELRNDEIKRATARRIADDSAYGGKTVSVINPDSSTVRRLSADTPIDKDFAATLRANGFTVPNVGDEITDEWLITVLTDFGFTVDGVSVRTTAAEVTRRTSLSPMPDKPSRILPLAPIFGSIPSEYVTLSGGGKVAGAVPLSISGAMGRTSDGGMVDDVWRAIEHVFRHGFAIPTAAGGTARVPFIPTAARRASDGAASTGRRFQSERLDDVISAAILRAYMTTRVLLAAADIGDLVTDDGSAYAPIGKLAGLLVTRRIKCGTCASCTRGGGGLRSRYSVQSCAEPKPLIEYTDAQRILSRALYASAAAISSDERYSEAYADPFLAMTGVPLAEIPELLLICGHGDTCQRVSCRAFLVIHAARIAYEVLDLAIIGANGRVAIGFLQLVAAAMGWPDTEFSRRKATHELRRVMGDQRQRRVTAARLVKATLITAETDLAARRQIAATARNAAADQSVTGQIAAAAARRAAEAEARAEHVRRQALAARRHGGGTSIRVRRAADESDAVSAGAYALRLRRAPITRTRRTAVTAVSALITSLQWEAEASRLAALYAARQARGESAELYVFTYWPSGEIRTLTPRTQR